MQRYSSSARRGRKKYKLGEKKTWLVCMSILWPFGVGEASVVNMLGFILEMTLKLTWA